MQESRWRNETKGCLKEEIKQTWGFEWNIDEHTFASVGCVCVPKIPAQGTVGQMASAKGSPPSIFKQALWTHSKVFPHEASLCVCPLPRPPTHMFYLFLVDLCSSATWLHVYLCLSVSSFPEICLAKPSPSRHNAQFENSSFSKRCYYTISIISDLMLAAVPAHCLNWVFQFFLNLSIKYYPWSLHCDKEAPPGLLNEALRTQAAGNNIK